MPILNKLSRFARSPQGQSLARKAMSYGKGGGAKHKPAHGRGRPPARRKRFF